MTINKIKNFALLSLLQLDYNEIEDISFLNRFENVNPFINSIYLTNNKIKKVPTLKSPLEILYLSDNLIETMDFL